MRYDSHFQLEMRWCTEHGVPHSVLLGWDESDRAKLMAQLLEESSRCGRCGTAAWEWDESPSAYVAAVHHCAGCLRLDAAAEDQTDVPAGSRIVLIPGQGR